MRKFTLKTEIVAADKASKNINKINVAVKRLTKNVFKESKLAGTAFARFSQKVSVSTKMAAISINSLNARVNNFARNAGKKLGRLGKLGLGIGLLSIVTAVVDANVQLDDSLASLSAITGKTGKEFDAFKMQVSAVAKEQTLFAGDTAKAFEIVASAQPILLGNAKALGMVTNAAITLSKASGDDLTQSAQSLTSVMNQFNLEATEAERTMNALAAGSVEGSANISNVASSLKNFGAVANSANITMEQSVALVEVMGSKSIFAEEAGTKLTAAVLNLQAAGVGYASGAFKMSDALKEVKLKVDAARTAKEKDAIVTKIFKKTGITTGQILLNNVDAYEKMTVAVSNTTTAVTQMNTKANTFSNRWNEIQASFKNSISATGEQTDQMQSLKDVMDLVAKNMNTIISTLVVALKIFAAFKIAVIAVNAVTTIWTAVQWAINTAFLGFPVIWIILAIIALIAIIVALVRNWDAVKAALIRFWETIRENPIAKFLLAPLFAVVDIVKYLITNFDTIKASVINFWNTIKDNPITKFLLAPIFAVIDAIKLMIEGIKKIAGFFGEETGMKIQKTEKSDIKIRQPIKTDQKLIESLDKNTTELDKNTKSAQKQWTGRFTTSILKDANISDRTAGSIQKELAISAVNNEINNSSTQNDIINGSNAPSEVVTKSSSRRNSNNKQGQIFINVIDKTGGKFGLEVEGTGVNLTTTGN